MPYVLADGTLVAQSWSDFTDGTLSHPLDQDEDGDDAPATEGTCNDALFWSGTDEQGQALEGAHCNGWTDASVDARGTLGNLRGDRGTWSSFCWRSPCDARAPLICIEQ